MIKELPMLLAVCGAAEVQKVFRSLALAVEANPEAVLRFCSVSTMQFP